MEGQQPDSGALSETGSETPAEVETGSETPAEVETGSETPADTETSITAAEAKVHTDPSAARKWLVRNKTKVSVLGSVGFFVAAGAFAGATAQPYLTDRAAVVTKMRIAETAANAITTLWTYTPENMDKLSDRAAKYLGGDFENQYRTYVDAIAATNKQAKVSSETKVVGAAVESLHGSDATAIVYTNTTSTTAQGNLPSMKYLSYRLDLKQYGRDWRVTKMTTVTSLDLTPKIGA